MRSQIHGLFVDDQIRINGIELIEPIHKERAARYEYSRQCEDTVLVGP